VREHERSRNVGKLCLSAFARKRGIPKSTVVDAIRRGTLAAERVEDPVFGVRVLIDEDAEWVPASMGRPLGSVNKAPRRSILARRAGGTPSAVAGSKVLRRV
jgi:hypothetical protein